MDESSQDSAKSVLKSLEKDYIVVGKSYIKPLHFWIVTGLIIGVGASVFYTANQQGEIEGSLAASPNTAKLLIIPSPVVVEKGNLQEVKAYIQWPCQKGSDGICHIPPLSPVDSDKVKWDIVSKKIAAIETIPGTCPVPISPPPLPTCSEKPCPVPPPASSESPKPSPPLTSSITVTWPTADVWWEPGRAYLTTWSTKNVPASNMMSIGVRSTKSGSDYLLIGDTINDGEENVTVSPSIPSGPYTLFIKSLVKDASIHGWSEGTINICKLEVGAFVRGLKVGRTKLAARYTLSGKFGDQTLVATANITVQSAKPIPPPKPLPAP